MRPGSWAIVFLLAGALHAQMQEQKLMAGYVLDSRQGTLRGVRGIPGAARLGDPIAFPQAIAQAAVRNGRAVVVSAEEPARVSLLRQLDAAVPERIAIDDAIAAVSRVYLNGTATTALLYSSSGETFQLITGLDATPAVSTPIPAAGLRGKFLNAAVAETQSCALLTSADEESGYLYRVCAGSGEMGLMAQLPGVRPAAVGWWQQDRDALVADAANHELLLLTRFLIGAAPIPLARATDGLEDPGALLPLNRTTIAVMNRGSASLVLADTSQEGATRRVELPESPTRLELLDGFGVLACTDVGPGPLVLVDPRRDFAAFYVPMN